MEIELTIAFVLATIVVAVLWALTGNPVLAVVFATTAAIVVVAIGDARRRAIQRNMSSDV